MGTIAKPNTFSAGATIVASEHNDNYDTIYNEFNGSIDNNNIKAAAGIVGSKLDLSAPGNIGATTAGTGKFTTLGATGVVSLGTGTALIPAISFTSDVDTGLFCNGSNQLDIAVGGKSAFTLLATELDFRINGTAVVVLGAAAFNPTGAGAVSTGTAAAYWNDISYKTLTDRGCLGWFDDGVELQDGSIVSDIEALLFIKKHHTKKTIYGVDMMDYKTFPKVAYKKAEIDGTVLPRDENDEPYIIKDGKKLPASDGIEMTSMFSIMIGAIKENAKEIKSLKEEIKVLKAKCK